MTISHFMAIGFLVVMIALILWNLRGHRRGGDGSDNHYQAPGPDDIIAGD